MNALQTSFHIIVEKLKSKANSSSSFRIQQWKMQDIIDLLGNGLCAYTGKEFSELKDMTFERVNPKVGYVPGNVLLVTAKANQQKSQLDSFIHRNYIPSPIKIKLLRKAIYQLEKECRSNK